MHTAATNRWNAIFTRVGAFAGLCAAMAVFFAGAPAAKAQTTDIDPHPVVVTTETASIRCGGGEIWYPVGEAKRGDILVADGESFGWLRVEYPEGVRALVSVDDAEFVAGRGVVRLTRPSRLAAYNPNADVRDSWRRLLPDPLPAATELQHHATLHDGRGEIAGFLVSAPAPARAYINEQFVRRATDAEVRAFRNRDAKQEETPQDQVAGSPESRPRTTPETTTTPRETTPETRAEPRTEPEYVERDTQRDPERPTPRPEEERAPVVIEMEQPDRTQPQRPAGPSPTRSATPAESDEDETFERGVATFDQLDRAFKQVVREPVKDAELEPLLAEHKRLLETLGDSEEDRIVADAVRARTELLEIRVELQKDLLRLAALEERATRGVTEIRQAVTMLEARRQYAAVGRLSTSSIYNGERMPLMYRLQSADTASPRTIAYIVPTEGVDLSGKLGELVGVEGVTQLDPALRLNIIRPRHVDALRVESATVAAPVQDEE